MFRYHGRRRSIQKRGPMPPNEVKEALERFLDDSQGVQLIRFLVRYWKDQQTVLTFREIREAILAGDVTRQMMKDWQQDYSRMVAEKLKPTWEAAMKAGALNQMAHKGLDTGFKFRKDHWAVRDWLRDRTAAMVTNCTDEQRKAIRNIIADGIQNKMSTRELEKFIRPCIGLTKPQAAANLRYYNNIKRDLREKHPRMTEASIEKKASEASMKYADRQLRERAYTIARTERAMAYEYGRFQHTKALIAEGLLPTQKKVWSAARNENTCSRCMFLHGQAVFMEEDFTEADGSKIFLPPLHPRCRCVTMYQDIENAKWWDSPEGIKHRMSLQLHKISAAQAEIIRSYTGFSAHRVNAALYSGNEKRIEKERTFICSLDNTLRKGVVPHNITVHRDTIPEFLGIFPKGYRVTEKDLKEMKGKTILCKGYMSTSFRDLHYGGRNVHLEIEVPQGYKGALYIRDAAGAKYKNQDEVLIKRGVCYKIKSIELIDGRYYIKAEVLKGG